MADYTLGSLFDGAGGFPLAGTMCGITPLWASEIEPFPIKVTTKRFPNMKHLGDVTKINGGEIDPVDIITFGSPCQDLSIAGGRAGLEGERSGLFMEAIRIIKEMRDKTDGRFPRFGVWENVPGAFSSAGGEDFRAVLEAFCRVKDSNAIVPRPADGWSDSGLVVGDGYSVGWRVLDAQFWGVPQRRRRIFLVADFTGGGAAEILFKRDGLSRHFAEVREAWQGTPEALADSVGTWFAVENHPMDSRIGFSTGNIVQTLSGRCGSGGNNTPYALCVRERCGCEGGGYSSEGDFSGDSRSNLLRPTQGSEQSDGRARPCDLLQEVIAMDRAAIEQGENAKFDPGIDEKGKAFTVIARGPGGVVYGN